MIVTIPAGILLLIAGIFIGGIVNLIPTPETPSYAVSRELLNTVESSGEASTRITLSISEIRDQMGKTIMSGMRRVAIAPGDAITIRLWMGMGHISGFELTDPGSGKPLSQTYPTTYGSKVVNQAELMLHVPQGASPSSNVSVPWRAEMFIRKHLTTEGIGPAKKYWFDLVKPVPISRTTVLPLTTPEIRKAWIRGTTLALCLKLLMYIVLASVLTAILVRAKRSFFAVVSTSCVFAGVTLMFVVSLADHLQWSAFLWWGGTLAIVLVVGSIARNMLLRFHSDVVNELKGVW
ncbi:MAG: hypothetical protein ABSD56_06570 [Bryobacteraceae bacterium]